MSLPNDTSLVTSPGVGVIAAPPHGRGFTIVRISLGLLLLTTAVLKMSGGQSQYLQSALPFLSPRLYTVGVVLEAILGAWLLIGIAPMWSWMISVGFFTLLAFLSFRLAMLGRATCGCAGRLPVHPWWAFTIDIVALTALLIFHPRWSDFRRELRLSIPTALRTAGFSAAFLGLFAGLAVLLFGSVDHALASMRGETFTLSPVVDLGTAKVRATAEGVVEATNYGAKQVLIYGSTNNCSCIGNIDLPVTVQPGERKVLRFQVRLPEKSGWFSRKIEFQTDCERARKVRCTIVGIAAKE